MLHDTTNDVYTEKLDFFPSRAHARSNRGRGVRITAPDRLAVLDFLCEDMALPSVQGLFPHLQLFMGAVDGVVDQVKQQNGAFGNEGQQREGPHIFKWVSLIGIPGEKMLDVSGVYFPTSSEKILKLYPAIGMEPRNKPRKELTRFSPRLAMRTRKSDRPRQERSDQLRQRSERPRSDRLRQRRDRLRQRGDPPPYVRFFPSCCRRRTSAQR